MEKLLEKTELSAKTITNYTNAVKRLNKMLGEEVQHASNADIIKTIKEQELTPSAKQTLLNVGLVIKKAFGDDVKSLEEYRAELSEAIKMHTADVVNPALKKELPSLAVLEKFTNQLYTDGKYVDYIINFLLLTGVRNQDLDLIIKKDHKDLNEDDNYLIIEKSKIRYVRGNYKTAKTYGEKTVVFNTRKFTDAVKDVLGEHESRYLLSNVTNSRISETSLNKYISTRTYNNIGQGKYFKVLTTSKKTNNEKLSEIRGTNPDTMEKHYNMKFKNLAGKAAKAKKEKKTE